MAANSGSLPRFLERPTSYTTGVWGWITTVDHKKIGIMYGFTAIFFFLLGGLEAVVIRSQLAFAENEIVSPDIYNQLFTMHALTMIFLAIMPLAVTFFNLIIPLQIGARDVAFPRLNALSYWIYVSGGLLLNAGWILGGAADSGWFAYAPLTLDQYGSGGRGMDFYSLGLLVLGVSSVAGGLNFLVTIINMRAPGMTLMRMPVFTWMAFITSILLVTAMPVITIALIELALDRILGTQFFAPGAGGDPLLWQHLFWVFGHPEVYILILPAMGIVSEVLPTFSKKPLFGYPFIIFSGIFIGFMGWAVWSHHMFTVGMGPVANATFAITTMLIAVPTGVKIFNWIGTMWGGSIDFKTPMLFSIGFVFLFIIGGLSGVSHAAPPSDYQQQDTYYIVAHLHYVLFGGAIFGIFSGIYYWWPKFSGKLLNENLGVIHFALIFIGMNMSFGPMHWLGMDGMPRRIYTYGAEYGWEFWNTVSTIGSYIIALGTIVFIVNVFYTMRQERRTDLSDPWDGRTLEWSIPSPVPEYNFKEIPIVNGLDSFWDTKYSTDEQGYMTPIPQGASDDNQEDEEVDIHMPGLSYFPFITGIGLSVSGFGFAIYSQFNVVGLTIAIVGVLATFFGAYGWCFEPADPEDHH
tara:strand:- start:5375 stop:7273 length:1899 start_codon:yes stop_codon:yes gene_type:complete